MHRKIIIVLSIIFLSEAITYAQSYELKKAQAFYYYQEYDSALFYLQKELKHSPNNPKLYIFKGDILLEKNNPNGALNNYLQANKIKNGIANVKTATAYSKLKNYKKTYNLLDNSLKNRKTSLMKLKHTPYLQDFINTDYWTQLKEKYKTSKYEYLLDEIAFDIKYKEYDNALDKIDNYLMKNNKKHKLYYLQGKILLLTSDTTGALSSFSKAQSLKPNNLLYLTEYTKLLINSKKYKKANKLLKNKTKKIANKPLIIKWLGISYYYTNKYNQSITILKDSVLKYYYKDTISWYYLSLSYFQNNNYFKALKAINQAIKLDPNNEKYLFLRGKIYYKTHAYKIAIKEFKKLIDLNPNNGKYFFYLAKTQFAIGEKYNACNNFHKAFNRKYMKADDYIRKFCVN